MITVLTQFTRYTHTELTRCHLNSRDSPYTSRGTPYKKRDSPTQELRRRVHKHLYYLELFAYKNDVVAASKCHAVR